MPRIEHVPMECKFCNCWAFQRIERTEKGILLSCTHCPASNEITIPKKNVPSIISAFRDAYCNARDTYPEIAVLRFPGDYVSRTKED